MAEPHFAGDDDLPRTLRRERDAREREREQRDRDAAMAAQAQPYPQPGYQAQDYGRQDYANADAYPMPGSGVVNRLEIPFTHLVWFFVKAVFAAVPALLLLAALLFGGGLVLKYQFPWLRHFEIIVRSPDDSAKPAAPVVPVVPSKK